MTEGEMSVVLLTGVLSITDLVSVPVAVSNDSLSLTKLTLAVGVTLSNGV